MLYFHNGLLIQIQTIENKLLKNSERNKKKSLEKMTDLNIKQSLTYNISLTVTYVKSLLKLPQKSKPFSVSPQQTQPQPIANLPQHDPKR